MFFRYSLYFDNKFISQCFRGRDGMVDEYEYASIVYNYQRMWVDTFVVVDCLYHLSLPGDSIYNLYTLFCISWIFVFTRLGIELEESID